jgi:hypothetical protein
MTSRSDDSLQALPPRLLRPDERKLVAEWLAAAGDVALAYVSARSSDDPTMYRRSVIKVDGDDDPSYLIDTPDGMDLRTVLQCRPELDAYEFGSLREALNFVRPVLCQSIDAVINGWRADKRVDPFSFVHRGKSSDG